MAGTVAAEPLLHCAVGLAQGLAVHALWSGWCHGCALDAAALWRTALSYAAAIAPMVWHFTSGCLGSQVRRAAAAVATGLLFGAMAAWTYGRSNPPVGWWGSPLTMPSFNLPLILLTALVVSLLVDVGRLRRRDLQAASADITGRNVLVLVAALFLTGLLWVLLGASGWLMRAIGVQAWLEVLGDFGFIAPVTCGAFGLAVGVVLQRPRELESVRLVAMRSIGWLLPLALTFLVAWSVALPFTGFAALRETRNAALYLSWFAVLCVVLANAWFQGHRDLSATPDRPWIHRLRRAMSTAWLLTSLLPVVAGWALWLRIDQHGLTPERVWGVAACMVLAVCTCGYSWSGLTASGWLSRVPATNTLASALLAATLALLMTPLADVRHLSVLDQVSRLRSGAVTSEAFDWQFLAYRTDHYGREALQRLTALQRETPLNAAIATRAERELAAIAKAASAASNAASAAPPRPRP